MSNPNDVKEALKNIIIYKLEANDEFAISKG
jgi:hypothetical protein